MTISPPGILMPLLKAEPNLYPPELLDDAGSDPEPESRWWAAYTLSRQEKALMRRLYAQRIAFYCPLIPQQYRSPQGRKRTSFLPLFSNYVFFRGEKEHQQQAWASGCISKCLDVKDPGALIAELRSIHRLIDAGQPLHVESKLMPGAPVRIKTGALAGVEGVVIERRGQHRLLVAVTLLQRGLSVSLEDWDIERL